MSKQFAVITQDGSKWLRPVPVTIGGPRLFYTIPSGEDDIPYIGSHPEGAVLSEDQVIAITQARNKEYTSGNWFSIAEKDADWNDFEIRTAYTDAESHDRHIKTYNYTVSQFDKFRDMPEYFEEGAIVNVTNNFTGKVTTYKVETKKVFTKTSKDWTYEE